MLTSGKVRGGDDKKMKYYNEVLFWYNFIDNFTGHDSDYFDGKCLLIRVGFAPPPPPPLIRGCGSW